MYEHFAKRLKYWYDLDITPLEYIDLIQARYDTLIPLKGFGRKVIKIRFKGVAIKAIKEIKGNKFLITALCKTYPIFPDDRIERGSHG